MQTDAVIVGAGPVGLFQVFQLGLLEIKAHVVDSLPVPGGQCAELYADKPIYDIPALPLVSGAELTARLLRQIEPFAPTLHLGQVVSAVEPAAGGGFVVETQAGTRIRCTVVIVAAGVGAFQPRPLKLAGIEAFAQHHTLGDTTKFAGQHVVVVGGEGAAVDAALRLADARTAASLTLVHRRDDWRADAADVARLRALLAAGALRFTAGQPIGFEHAGGRLTALRVAGADGTEHVLPLGELLVLQGISPRLGPIAEWGLALERRQVVVDTERFETSTPGIHAVGDIVTYPGKKKLIVCGFHEATLAAFAAASRVYPERAMPLQYTTTSPRLHALLGVAPLPP